MTSPATVLFVGNDLCARTRVLANVGYEVLQCECNSQAVGDALRQAPVDAVLFHCDPTAPEHLVISAARASTSAPIVLFANTSTHFNEADYDVVVPSLCSPLEWLQPIAEAIELHHNPDLKKLSMTP